MFRAYVATTLLFFPFSFSSSHFFSYKTRYTTLCQARKKETIWACRTNSNARSLLVFS